MEKEKTPAEKTAEFLTELDKLGITEKEYYFKGSDWYSRRERFGLE